MTWSRQWQLDVRRAEAPTRREERPFLLASALIIVTVAQLSDPGSATEVLLLAPAVLAYVLRGWVATLPSEVFAALVILPVGLVVGSSGHLEVAYFLVVIMVLYTAWHLGSTTRAAAILVAAAVTPWLAAVLGLQELNWTAWTAACVFTFVLGRNLRRQRLLIEELEAARHALADAAVAEERRRIARELHDLAGHTLAAMLLHVTGARHVLRRDLADAERALLDAETVGRSSLDQIRVTVAALRTRESGTDPPLPGPAEVVRLVDGYRRAGLDITARLPDDLELIDGPAGTALHRILRESLANVARHAPSNRVEVSIDVADLHGDGRTDVHLVVADHGRRAVAPRRDSGCFGLVGMHERARGLGGELVAGPSADGWRVEARLPLTGEPDESPVST